jgi:hypothetical protein
MSKSECKGDHRPPASAEVGAGGKPDGGVCPATGGHPTPRQERILSRARMTVLADHGAPLGVSIWRAFNSAATARADALSRSGASNAGTADEATGTSAFASCGVTENSLGLVPRITVIGTKTLLY